MSEEFRIGNVVTWSSQAQGSAKTKVGTIIEIVPPDISLRSPPASRSRAKGTTGLW